MEKDESCTDVLREATDIYLRHLHEFGCLCLSIVYRNGETRWSSSHAILTATAFSVNAGGLRCVPHTQAAGLCLCASTRSGKSFRASQSLVYFGKIA